MANQSDVAVDFIVDGDLHSFRPKTDDLDQQMLHVENLQQTSHVLTATSRTNAPFILDYIVVHPGDESPSSSSTYPTSTGLSDTATATTSTEPSATASPPPDSHVSAGAIAGGVIGGVVFLVVIATIVFIFLRRRRRRQLPAIESNGKYKSIIDDRLSSSQSSVEQSNRQITSMITTVGSPATFPPTPFTTDPPVNRHTKRPTRYIVVPTNSTAWSSDSPVSHTDSGLRLGRRPNLPPPTYSAD